MRRGGVKSFVDDLVLGRGVVPSRAATSLRSVETQPLTRRFVRTRRATSPFVKKSLVNLLRLFALLLLIPIPTIYLFFFFPFSSSVFFCLFSLSLFSLCVFSPLLGGRRENPSLAAWGGAGTAVQTAGQQFERWWRCVSRFPLLSVSVCLCFSENRASPLNPPCPSSAVTSTLVGVWWFWGARGVRDWLQFSKFFFFFFFTYFFL